MKKILLLTSFLIINFAYANAPQWGKTGHRATMEIAQQHLTKKAKKNIQKILGKDTGILLSTFPDEIKSDRAYDQYGIWHYINIPEGKTYDAIKDEVGPNIIWAIGEAKRKLKDETVSPEKKKFYLTMLIHLIGDLHQPMHIGRPEDLGGNRIIVFWFNQPSNLHKVWDSEMLDSYKMSYSELAANRAILSDREVEEISQGNEVDWMEEVFEITQKVYDSAENGHRLSYDYMYHWMPVVREQIHKGGIRLAKELNELFG